MKRIRDILTRHKAPVSVDDSTSSSTKGAVHASPGKRPGERTDRESRAESPTQSKALTFQTIRLGEVLRHRKGSITIDDTTSYKLCRVQLHRRGVVLRQKILGAQIGTKSQQVCKAGDFLVAEMDAKVGGYGFVPPELDGAIVSSHYFLFEVDESRLHSPYLEVISQTDILQQQIVSKGSTNYASIRPAQVLGWQIPLPDMASQKRIAARFQTVQTKLAAAQHEIAHQQTLLSKLKQAILQEAIQGKLTDVWRAANPDVEPASQLLKRIQAEKARLIAEKKLRPEKLLPKISPEEIPFEIPENWKWCRLGAITTDVSYGTSQKAHLEAEGIPVLRMGNITTGGTLAYSNLKYVSPKIKDLPRLFLESGDIVFNRTNSYELVGKSAVFRNEKPFTLASYLIRVRLFESLVPEYTAYFINSEICRTEFIEPDVIQQNGQANFNGTKLKTILIPLPPLAEQAAIVERVEALMTTCRALEAEIEQCRTHAAHLLQAVLKEAFAPSSESTPSATTCPPTVPLLSP